MDLDSMTSATLAAQEMPIRRKKSDAAIAKDGEAPVMVEVFGVGLTVEYYVCVAVSKGAADAEAVEKEVRGVVDECFKEVEATFSPFFANSELNQVVNAEAIAYKNGVPLPSSADSVDIAISPEMYGLLGVCDKLHRMTGGVFDPTAVAVGQWYVSECKKRGVNELPPEDAAFVERRQFVGWSANVKLESRPGGRYQLWKRHPAVHVDPTAVSKGWCVDHIVERLQSMGLADVYVDWGGDIRAHGIHPKGRQWATGIQHPADRNANLTTVSLGDTIKSGCALCTSGDYNSLVLLDRHHLIDPKDGAPRRVGPCASVTVVTRRSCAIADGIATAMLLLETDEAQKVFVKQFNEQPIGGEHIFRHVAVMRPTGSTSASIAGMVPTEMSTLMRFSLPPEANTASAEVSTMSVEDKATMRTLIRLVPRSVVIFFAGIPETPQTTPERFFGVTMSSPVAVAPDLIVVFVMNNSLMVQLLGGNDVKAMLAIPPVSIVGNEVSDDFGRGKWLDMAAIGAHAGLQVLQSATVVNAFDVGDHKAVLLRTSVAAGSTEWDPSLGVLMRVGRGYESVGLPKAKPKHPLLPRACAMATVTRGESGKAKEMLATILRGVDTASLMPTLITGVAPATKLNTRVFREWPAKPNSAVTVRVHFLPQGHDAGALLDWFGDGNATDPGGQFMYHPYPQLGKAEMLPPPAAGSPESPIVNYSFGSSTVGAVDCYFERCEPLPDAANPIKFLVVLRPQRSGVARSFEADKRLHLAFE